MGQPSECSIVALHCGMDDAAATKRQGDRQKKLLLQVQQTNQFAMSVIFVRNSPSFSAIGFLSAVARCGDRWFTFQESASSKVSALGRYE